MSTVWLVRENDWEMQAVRAVAATRELAKAAAERYVRDRNSGADGHAGCACGDTSVEMTWRDEALDVAYGRWVPDDILDDGEWVSNVDGIADECSHVISDISIEEWEVCE